MHTTIGKIPFGKYELNVRAIAGELIDHKRETLFHIPRRDTVSIRVGEQVQRVCVPAVADVPMRIGHRVTAFYASVAGRDNWQLVAFSDDSAHKVHDVSESARLSGAKARIVWQAPLAALVIFELFLAITPWFSNLPLRLPSSPETTMYFYVACAWGCAVASYAYLLRRHRAAKKRLAQWRSNLLEFIRHNAGAIING